MEPLLSIKDLWIRFETDDGVVNAVNGVELSLNPGDTLGLVGETGAGKTTMAMGILRIVPEPGNIYAGSIEYKGENLLTKSDDQMRAIRGGEIAMIFQDPMTALNPVMKVVDQIEEMILLHGNCSKSEATERALEMLEKVGIPRIRGNDYPHQFSGGMKQRVIIAMALSCQPKLIIADEPTTALDVTIQAQILEMMRKLKTEIGTSMLMITHDLGVVAETCDKVAIMYAGEIVECGAVEHIFEHTSHPYTKMLFDSIPSLDERVDRLHPIAGLMPDPTDLPKGCKFNPRCPYATERCHRDLPKMKEVADGHFVRCHRSGDWGKDGNE